MKKDLKLVMVLALMLAIIFILFIVNTEEETVTISLGTGYTITEETDPLVIEVEENQEGLVEPIIIPIKIVKPTEKEILIIECMQKIKYINKTGRGIKLQQINIKNEDGWNIVSLEDIKNSRANSKEYYLDIKDINIDTQIYKDTELNCSMFIKLSLQVPFEPKPEDTIALRVGEHIIGNVEFIFE